MEPVVNRLEKELGDYISFLRVDIQSAEGEEISALHGSRMTPTFILFDPHGKEIYRSIGQLDEDQVRSLLTPYK